MKKPFVLYLGVLRLHGAAWWAIGGEELFCREPHTGVQDIPVRRARFWFVEDSASPLEIYNVENIYPEWQVTHGRKVLASSCFLHAMDKRIHDSGMPNGRYTIWWEAV